MSIRIVARPSRAVVTVGVVDMLAGQGSRRRFLWLCPWRSSLSSIWIGLSDDWRKSEKNFEM